MASTAKENIAKLPETIWSVLLIDKSLIQIKAGESGFYKRQLPPPNITSSIATKLNIDWWKLTTDHIADYFNQEEGKTKAMRRAMEANSDTIVIWQTWTSIAMMGGSLT